MAKPWEETWEADGAHVVLPSENRHVYQPVTILKGDGEDAERARLAAAAPEMARLLRKLHEDFAGGEPSTACNFCGWWFGDGGGEHTDDCPLVAVLVKAGAWTTSAPPKGEP